MSKDWRKNDASGIPKLIADSPVQKSLFMHEIVLKFLKRMSSDVKLFSVCFDHSS